MNVQFVRLADDICEKANRLARDQRITVSELVNRILRERLALQEDAKPAK